MEEQVVLYDLREEKYPSWRGAEFRSLQVHECPICGALTNRVIIGGAAGYGVRTICPESHNHWHHELENKVEFLQESHPESYKEELRREIVAIRRKYQGALKNDLTGNPDFTLREGITTCCVCLCDGDDQG